MSIFTHYRAFLTGAEYKTSEFETTEDLLGLDCFKKHLSAQNFLEFCALDETIMAVYTDKLQIVGYATTDIKPFCDICHRKHRACFH